VAELRTIPGVELIKLGTWEASTGTWTVTPDQLQSVIAADAAGVLRKPVIKIGHDDPRFDGSPAFGHLDKLRLADAGRTLVGDYVGVPAWLADAIPTSYPDRSVEALRDFEASDGTVWPLVLTGVALLGATAPAISDLASLQQLVTAKRITFSSKGVRSPHTLRERAVIVAAARRVRTHRKANS
jgi:hypothetical protein